MSIIGNLKQVTSEQLKNLIENPDLIESLIFEEVDDNYLDLDKAWHGIHFLLNDDVWGGNEPLRFVVMGREEIGEDIGYGPTRYLTSSEVKDISRTLSKISIESLIKKFDAERFKKADIYPSIWEEEDAIDYLMEYYKELVDYYNDAAKNNNVMLVYLT